MKTYQIKFVGRQVGAIGIFQSFNVKIKAESEEKAILSLYATHEHIRVISIAEKAERYSPFQDSIESHESFA